MSLFSVVGITKAIREVASVIATPRRERIATAALQGLLAKGADQRMWRYDNWRAVFTSEVLRFADDLIAELDRTAKPTPAVGRADAELADALRDLTKAVRAYVDNSEGIAGWHRNGDIEPWGATDIPAALAAAGDLLAKVDGGAR